MPDCRLVPRPDAGRDARGFQLLSGVPRARRCSGCCVAVRLHCTCACTHTTPLLRCVTRKTQTSPGSTHCRYRLLGFAPTDMLPPAVSLCANIHACAYIEFSVCVIVARLTHTSHSHEHWTDGDAPFISASGRCYHRTSEASVDCAVSYSGKTRLCMCSAPCQEGYYGMSTQCRRCPPRSWSEAGQSFITSCTCEAGLYMVVDLSIPFGYLIMHMHIT